MKIIILLGKSGCGKGTQAELLAKKFSFDSIGSGDLLRARSLKNDFTGTHLADALKKGVLVPMPVIFKLWLDRVEELKNKKGLKGIIMDGNPRRIFEARLIDEAFCWYGWEKDVKAFNVAISDKEAVWRLTKRRMCVKCNQIIPYIGKFKEMEKCPKCAGDLVARNDDTVASAKNRLKWFKKEVQPIINYYKKTRRLVKINGEQPIENVFEDILTALK